MMKLHTKTVIIFALLNFVSLYAFGQEARVEGTVLSASGDPLQHVRISVRENPDMEIYTDDNGNFSVSAETGQHLLLEYKSSARKIVAISDVEQERRIVLDETSELVDVGFNTAQRSEEMASSIGSVNSKELDGTSVFVPGNALYGKIPGLRVFQNTGYSLDGRQPDMDIRGQATTRNNSILVLVDGIERLLDTIVLEEIESVSVLRDAAAKAKYGQRGANGVLLITTKRGHVGKAQYNVSFEQGIAQPSRLPQFLNAPNYARSVNEAMRNDGFGQEELRYTQTDIDRFGSGDYPTLWPNVNWVDETLSNREQFSRFNFDVSGGMENVAYYMNLNYQENKGLFKHTEAFEDFSTQLDYDKLNFRTNLDIDLTPTTLALINMAGYVTSTRGPRNWWNVVNNAFNIPSAAFPIKNYDGSWGGSNQLANNPVAMLSDAGQNTHLRNSWLVDVGLEQDLNIFAEGLSMELLGAYDTEVDYWENQDKTFPFKEITPVVDESGAIVDTTISQLGEDSNLSPSRRLGQIQTYHYDLRGKLKYANSFDDRDQTINSWILFQQELYGIRGTNNQFRRRNFAGNIHYGLAGKYFLDATISYYGTNRIQDKQDRYGLFPAIGAAWLISKESFMSDVDFLNSLKLRASYGKVGNGRIPMRDLTHLQFGGARGYILGTNYRGWGGMDENQIPIERKIFESSYESNIGIESQLFDKLDVNFELFYTKRKNIFVPSAGQYSEVLGILPEQTPSGVVENKGYELDMTWRGQSGDFAYSITGQFSQYQNKIVNINEEHRPHDYMKREGEAIGQYFGWQSEGFYASESDIENSATSLFGEVLPGDIKYIDQNGDGFIDEFDQQPVGYSSTPEIYYSATFGLQYKGLQVSASFQGTERSSAFLNQPNVFWPLRSINGNVSTWYDNYWGENNQGSAELPRLTTESNSNNFRVNDIWIRDNSYLKLRYAEIAYSLPKNFISKFRLQQVKIYLRGYNLFSLDNINYVDPENTWSTYPSLRRYNTGINITF